MSSEQSASCPVLCFVFFEPTSITSSLGPLSAAVATSALCEDLGVKTVLARTFIMSYLPDKIGFCRRGKQHKFSHFVLEAGIQTYKKSAGVNLFLARCIFVIRQKTLESVYFFSGTTWWVGTTWSEQKRSWLFSDNGSWKQLWELIAKWDFVFQADVRKSHSGGVENDIFMKCVILINLLRIRTET